LGQRAFEVGETPFGRHVGAPKTLAAPFRDRMQRRVLQKLRAAPFDPGVRGVAQPTMKFFNQARFAEPRLTISSNCPSHCHARSRCRISMAISSRCPISGVRLRCPECRPPPLARTSRCYVKCFTDEWCVRHHCYKELRGTGDREPLSSRVRSGWRTGIAALVILQHGFSTEKLNVASILV
jgi:hypothetical protein